MAGSVWIASKQKEKIFKKWSEKIVMLPCFSIPGAHFIKSCIEWWRMVNSDNALWQACVLVFHTLVK